jgi:hypothetical protein
MGYQGINTFVCSCFLSARRFFVPREHCWGNHIYWGSIWGYNICHGDEEIYKLQKTIPRNFELPATLCRGRPKCCIKYYLHPIILISPISCYLVSISFSRNTKMCSRTTDCNGLSSTYSYVHHGTRTTVSFMFC